MTTLAKVIVIAGPTASGKSALAVAVAEEFGGVVINADSQQSYRDLSILTARPTAAEEARVPHRLFGTLDPLERDSAPAWAERAAEQIAAAADAGQVPILVGGTGLYLRTLMVGLPAMPAVPPATRAAARALMDEIGHEAFHARLAEHDPVLAARLKVGDTQRVLRAWEVVDATGRPLSDWQQDPPQPPIAAAYFKIAVMPSREDLNAAGEARFNAMLAAGALAQVAALVGTGIGSTAPVMRALGAIPLASHLVGEITLEEAVALSQAATRQYAKRQRTWFRNQFAADFVLETKFSESLLPEVFSKIRRFLLT